MGILDKLLGREDEPRRAQRPVAGVATPTADEQAIARYRYMLQTAPPQTLEQAHAEAFAKLTPEQRTLLLQQLAAEMPEAERSATAGTLKADPQSLARLATRAEVRQPGTLERSFNGMGGRGGGMGGMGGMMAGSFLASMAGVVVGSAIAQSFFADSGAGDIAVGDSDADATAGDTGTDVADVADAGDVGDFDEI
ncbi:MAG: hypothetical protein H6R06_2885 [Proteobacteria bacterium]|nr:hypothetical protein [Pseudomonadota bacterium]